jgi:hypothetical protein
LLADSFPAFLGLINADTFAISPFETLG